MGARLQRFWEVWEHYSVDQWVVSVLREGYRIPFERQPPLTSIPLEFPSYRGNSEKQTILQEEVEDMLKKEAIEVVEPGHQGFYNRLFLVPKASGKYPG